MDSRVCSSFIYLVFYICDAHFHMALFARLLRASELDHPHATLPMLKRQAKPAPMFKVKALIIK
jgi:hypothetical protein